MRKAALDSFFPSFHTQEKTKEREKEKKETDPMASSPLSGSRWNASKRREEGSPTSVLSFRRLSVVASAAEAAEAAGATTSSGEPTLMTLTATMTNPRNVFDLLDSSW